MASATPFEYGIEVSDGTSWGAALAELGFETAEGAPIPVAASAALALLVNPQTGQRIQLYRRDVPIRTAPGRGDVSIGIPVTGDPAEALAAIRVAAPALAIDAIEELPKEKGLAFMLDGQRLILTSTREPFTVVHYGADEWHEVLEFYEDVLGFCFFPLPDRGNAVRTRLENAAGRVDLEASPDTAARPIRAGGHFRLVNGKLEQAVERMPSSQHGRWLAPPMPDRAWAEGPAGEVMEVVAKPDGQDEER